MRLINARTYELEEFWDEHAKEYAILSHRWEGEEVSFKEMRNLDSATRKKGFAKIERSCKQALKHGLEYVWVDTCCIDKKSSAELSEAINSMFRWYKASAVCYAFLSDVASKPIDLDMEEQVKSSKWFTRGWTLQELIAPRVVVFYNQQWERLGTRETMRWPLTKFTGINVNILNGSASVSKFSIAERMFWASQRTTTRIEDTAYCLLGIFDVNMPLLYGEGERAFLRLQQEIIKDSDDHSIFAWPINGSKQTGLFAHNPQAFATCRYFRAVPAQKGRSPYSLTNRGLSIKLLAVPHAADVYHAYLNCSNDGLEDKRGLGLGVGIFLKRLNEEDDQYARIEQEGQTFMVWSLNKVFAAARPPKMIEFNIRQYVTNLNGNVFKASVYGFRYQIRRGDVLQRDIKVTAPVWNATEGIMASDPGHGGTVGILDFRPQGRKLKLIKLGFDFDFNPVCFIATAGGLISSEQSMKSTVGLTADQIAQLPPIEQRDPDDELGWSLLEHHGATKQLPCHPGLWALKVDRIYGLYATLEGLGSMHMVRGDYGDKLIWNLYVDV